MYANVILCSYFFVWEYFFFHEKKNNNKNFFNNNSKDLKPVRLLLATLQTGNTVCHVWLTLTLHISQPHFLEILFQHFAPFILSIRGSLLCLPPHPPTPLHHHHHSISLRFEAASPSFTFTSRSVTWMCLSSTSKRLSPPLICSDLQTPHCPRQIGPESPVLSARYICIFCSFLIEWMFSLYSNG